MRNNNRSSQSNLNSNYNSDRETGRQAGRYQPNYQQGRYRTENNRSEKQGEMNDRYYSSRDNESNDQDYRDQYQSYTRGASPSESPSYESGSDYGYGRDQYRASNSDRNFGNNDRYQGMNSGYNYNSETAPTSYGERFNSRHAYDEGNASDQPRSNYSSRFDQFSRTGSYSPTQNDREFTTGTTNRNEYSTSSQGQHFGKGPKNYKRADTRIQEEVCDALTHDSEVDASEVEVSVKEGIVTLSGTVSERSMKRAAEDCAERVSGVTDVKNEISTQSRSSFGSTSTDSKTTGTQTAGKNKTGSSTSNFM